ncbi:12435_t:CDS:2 [Gigaspora margarita]|uniref:12435_t:CDS:1 n=1 Tax=Gigaspora margarita TaxID=4874 RepID=A0ABN7UZ13_GIGMA|nr:12435_t:CDS:2 [Gigaspora margarita]
MATETSFINNQRKLVNLSLSEGNLAPEGSLAKKLDAICEKILSGSLEETSQSVTAHDELQNRIGGNKEKEVWRVALRAY